MIKVSSFELIPLVIEELKTKEVSLTVTGKSMWPVFKDGITLVTLKSANNYKRLDVVLAKDNNRYVLHRIIKIKDNVVTLRGDGLLSREVVNLDDVYGKVIKYKNKKEILESNKWYKFKVRLWMLLPFKRVIIKVFKR